MFTVHGPSWMNCACMRASITWMCFTVKNWFYPLSIGLEWSISRKLYINWERESPISNISWHTKWRLDLFQKGLKKEIGTVVRKFIYYSHETVYFCDQTKRRERSIFLTQTYTHTNTSNTAERAFKIWLFIISWNSWFACICIGQKLYRFFVIFGYYLMLWSFCSGCAQNGSCLKCCAYRKIIRFWLHNMR